MSRRVHIREHIAEDLPSSIDWQTDPEIARHVSWLPRSLTDVEVYLRDAIDQQDAENRMRYFFAVVLNDTGEMIGDVGFSLTDGRGNSGWFLRREFWGKGYAIEAVTEMVSYAFQKVGLAAMHASCRVANSASVRVMQKCGFVLTQHTDHRQRYTLLQPDWEESQGR